MAGEKKHFFGRKWKLKNCSLLLVHSEFKGKPQPSSQKMQVLKVCSDDLPPLIFLPFLVASAVVSLSFCLTKSSLWLERQVLCLMDGCIHGSFVLSHVGLLTFALYGQQPHSFVEPDTTLSLYKA